MARGTLCSPTRWSCDGRSSASPPNAGRCQSAGAIPEDYEFEGDGGLVKLSELFASGKDTLAIYSFMYGPERERPCPGCTHFLDALDGEAEHILQRINLAVIAKSPLLRIIDFAKERGWRRQRLLSTAGNSYDSDYFGDSTGLPAAIRVQQEFKAGEEWGMPMCAKPPLFAPVTSDPSGGVVYTRFNEGLWERNQTEHLIYEANKR